MSSTNNRKDVDTPPLLTGNNFWEINQVKITGANQTRESVFKACIDPLFTHKGPLEQMLSTVQTAVNQLNDLHVFENIDIQMHAPATNSSSSSMLSNKLDLTFNVKEKSRLRLETGTHVGHQEGSVHASGIVRNVFGGGECVSIHSRFGTRTRSMFEGSFIVPILTTSPQTPLSQLQLLVSQSTQSNQFQSSHDLQTRTLALRLYQSTWLGQHTYQVSGEDRLIHQIADKSSLEIRHQAGQSRKLGISHILAFNTKPNRFTGPGTHAHITSELFKITNTDAYFYKQVVNLSQTIMIPKLSSEYTLNLGVRASAVLPLNHTQALLPFPDRVFLGGPTCVRGFTYNGLGPKSQTDRLGGNLSYALGMSVFGPIPFFKNVFGIEHPDWFRLHGYVNGGHCESVLSLDAMTNFLRSCPSVSMGFGLAMYHPAARLELNFSVPVVVHANDGVQRGFGVGLGVDFL